MTCKEILVIVLITFCFALNTLAQNSEKTYQCLPCGQDCDLERYKTPGKCPHCQMDLIESSSITFKTIAPSKLCAYVKSHPKVVLLDVRTVEEFEGRAETNFGTLKNAVNAPIQLLESDLGSIQHLKNKEIIVFCSHSHRSPRVSYLLTQNGFKNLTNMSGGMSVMPAGDCVKR